MICGITEFWPCTYDPSCAPLAESPAGHEEYAKIERLSCHVAGGAAGPGREFLFAGVAYSPSDGTGVPQVEIAVRDGAAFYYACSDSLGFFFVPGAGNPEPDWMNVETRMRAKLGQKTMPDDKEHKPTCNEANCHASIEHPLLAPF